MLVVVGGRERDGTTLVSADVEIAIERGWSEALVLRT